jgi:hypothetical protein
VAVSEAAGTTTDGVQIETRYWYPPCSLVFVGSDGRHYRLDEDQWGDLPPKEQALAQGLLAHAQMRLMPQRWVAGTS